MIRANMAPASPPFAGRLECQIAGVFSPRMSSKSPSLFTLFGANVVMSRSPAQSSRCLMSSHDRPIVAAARAGIAAARAHEHPRSLQLVSVQRELQVALLQRRIDVVHFRRPRSAVPEHHDSGAVAFRNDPFELAVVERMIFDVHREPLRLWDRATDPWAPPTTAARRCARDGSRSGGGWRDASARRRSSSRPLLLDDVPAGSGVFVKSRFLRYSSSAMR